MKDLLVISRIIKSTYYDNKQAIESRDKDMCIENKIHDSYNKYRGRYGYRKITIVLNRDDEICERLRIEKYIYHLY